MAYTLFTFQYNFLILFFLLTMIPLSAGKNANYAICKNNPFSCGNITSWVPILGRQQAAVLRPSAFYPRLSKRAYCQPVFLSIGYYKRGEIVKTRVVSINTSSHTMSLVQKPFSDNIKPISCQRLILNETVFNLSQPFKFSPLVANISLFLSCGVAIANYSSSLKFLTSNSVNSTADSAYYVDKPENVANISNLCSTRRVFPVLKSELDDLSKGNASLTEVLTKGFEVEYTVDFNVCLACQNSRGVCGSSDDNEMRFVCYCSGGFGCVYKGKLLDGRFVAVKLLNKMKGNGDDFINEVLSISRTNHVNVVTLLGFCLEGNKRALIYEYLVNGSLNKYINGHDTHPSLQWKTLFKIAVGIARGLNYLHRGCNARILHFDIKPHNVLLDEEFSPKISDFGLAKLCPTKDSTISMLEARGTIGYIAPEVVYRNIGGVSHKSDVYSYGMMVLNMACGRSNLPDQVERSSEQYFPEWIFNQLEQTELATKAMLNEEEKEMQRKMIMVSLWCIQTYPSDRPSMNRVLEMIEGPLESLPMPPRAA